jgi:lysophospholipase L1-like esterase
MATSYEDIVQGAYGAIGRTGIGTGAGTIDQEGYNFWLDALKAGAVTPDQLLANFNQAVAATIQQQPQAANSQAVAAYIAANPLATQIDPTKVVAVGDSTTWGYNQGNQVAENMVTTAQKALGSDYSVSNLGINSTTAGDFLNSTDFDKALSSGAGTVVLNYGMNEAYRNEDPATFAKNLLTAVQTLQAVGKKVILQTPNSTGASTKPEDAWTQNVGTYADVVRDVAKQTGTTLDDKFTYTSTLKNATSSADIVHPTAATYGLLGTNLADAIKTTTTGVAPTAISVTAPASTNAQGLLSGANVVPTASVPSLKDQLLSQWSKLGITELGGGIPLEKRAADLADTMARSNITNLADLKLGSAQVPVGEEGATEEAGFLTNKGQQIGFVGNVGDLENKGKFLQPDNLVSWTAEGGGNVSYKAVETADGGVSIVPQWNSSSDMKFIRDGAKMIAAVYGAGTASEGLFGTLGGEAALTATDLAIGGGAMAGTPYTAAQLAGFTTGAAALTPAEIAALTATDLAIGGTAGAAGLLPGGVGATGLLGGAATIAALTPAEIAALTAQDLAIGAGSVPLTAAQIAAATAIPAGAAIPAALTNAGVSTAVNKILGGGTSNLGNLLNTGLTTAGGLLQQQTSKEAAAKAQAMIDAETAAAKTSAAFRPVGMTTRFGTSQFGFDPKTGQMTSAGYTLSPEAKAQQDRFVALSNAGLTQAEGAQAQFAPLQTGAQSLFGLGNKYLAQTPESVAQNYLTQQMALLQPGRELELANLQNRLQQQGRGGLAVAQGGTMGATTPELQALYNARAQQEAQLAAQAQQYGQQNVLFGAGLLGQGAQAMGQYYGGQQAAYAPYTTAMGQVQNLEALGQQPFQMGAQLGTTASTAGARAGALGLEGANISQRLATGSAATTNPYATALGGVSSNPAFAQLLGNITSGLFSSGAPVNALSSSGYGPGMPGYESMLKDIYG